MIVDLNNDLLIVLNTDILLLDALHY